MKLKDKKTLNAILAHKDYFDQRLVEIASYSEDTIHLLNGKINELQSENLNLSTRLRGTESQLKDRDYKINQMSRLLSKKDEDIEDIRAQLEELKKEIKKQIDENERLTRIVEDKIKKNEEMEEELLRKIRKLTYSNSTNSNLGTSHDILSHTVAKAQANTRVKSERKRGGQKGHPVHRRTLSSKPDVIIEKHVSKIPTGALKVEDGNNVYYATQEIDLVFKSKIIETRYYPDENGETPDKETLKKYAVNPVSYSDTFKAGVVYLNQRGTIALERLSNILNEMSNGTISVVPSTIVKWNREISDKSSDIRLEILSDILSEPVVHVDETGEKINGNTGWMHTITNDKGAFFISTSKRGDLEKGPIAYLENYDGTLVHDHFKSYQRLKKCRHAECGAHIDRYLKSGIDIDHNEDCKKMLELLHGMLKRKEEYINKGAFEMPKDEIEAYRKKYIEIAEHGIKTYYESQKGRTPRYVPDYVSTFRRMIEFVDDHLRFITDFKVPYTNNAAERQCRTIKAKKKISGQFVADENAKAYADVLTIIQTASIRKENALDALRRVFI